ncbi:SDR family NAD(P)-dependent oxidoreductase [Pseudonocardia endophytica]|nr:SDR family NAD(P)-dependent oxidoreductase [Pseudonocardia endophytica]
MKDKVSIVTGASGGIGSATANALAEAGGAVLMVDLDRDALDVARSKIPHARVETFAADVTDKDQVEAYTTKAVELFGGLDAVILNAGLFGSGYSVGDYPEELFDKVLAVNLKGPWYGLRAALPHLRRRGRGSIVITSSTQGLSGYYGSSPYTTSKHGVVGMARNAAVELATEAIRVNTVHPGMTDTSMMGGLHQEANPDDPQSVMDAFAAAPPIKRYAQPDEIAQVMLFLASDASSYCTGSTFVVDGGLLAYHGGPSPE